MKIIRQAIAVLALLSLAGAVGAQETVEYIHTDALGSPVAVSDAGGTVIERSVYEPYGASVGRELTDGPGYTGHVSDSATGLSYMQQRYMDPQLGAFLSVDPVTAYEQPVGQFNRYRYANGNPYKFTDPDGRQAAERFVEQHRKDMEAGNGDVYKPLQPYAIAATGVMLTPVAVEVAMAALVNPVAIATATEIGAGAAGVTGTAGVASLAGKEAGVARDFFSGAKYTDKVLGQMKQGDYHAFPEGVTKFQSAGQVTSLKGGDGVAREMLKIPGEYKGRKGSFEFIKEPDSTINHRLFKPDREL